MADGAKQRFFISYAGVDRPWAEWVGWYLKAAGHDVELDVWDWRPGDDFVDRMDRALRHADAVVALFSKAYFDPKRWTRGEKNAALAGERRIIPLVVEELADTDLPPLLSSLVSRAIHGLGEAAAREALREAVEGARLPDAPPVFPGGATEGAPATDAASVEDGTRPRLPGSPAGTALVSNLGRRNPDFSGRESEIARLRDELLSDRQAVVRALHGMGGIGKTQLALEYAHRFSGQYDVVWWIDAEQAGHLPVHYTELAGRLGLARSEAGSEANARALLAELRGRQRWLIVLDNAERPELIGPWLPDGPGHVLITSRNPDWRGVAGQTGLDVFDRADSVSYLRSQIPALSVEDAGLLAHDLGDLPLALAQAAGVVGSGMTVERYRGMLATDAERILRVDRAPGYPVSLAAATGIALGRLEDEHPGAVDVLRLGAFLGPEPIPISWLETAGPRLVTVSGVADDVLWPRSALQPLRRAGLARVDHETFQIHRLTQSVLRDRTGVEHVAAVRDDAGTVLEGAVPGDPETTPNWPAWATLASHLAVARIDRVGRAELRSLLLDAALFLTQSGQAPNSRELTGGLSASWTEALGADHPDTLRCMQYHAHAATEAGDPNAAVVLIHDTLARRRRLLGDDHPDTLQSANDLAYSLGQLHRFTEAHEIMEDTYRRRRRVLGEHHPHTLQAAYNLAAALSDLEEYEESGRMCEDLFQLWQRDLGDDHPDTLRARNGIASAMINLGRIHEGRDILEDVNRRLSRALGDNHVFALSAADNLAQALTKLGDHERARGLLEAVLRRSQESLGPSHPNTIVTTNNLAHCLFRLRKYAEAVELFERARNDGRRVLGDDTEFVRSITRGLANTLTAMGKSFQAQRLLSAQRKQSQRASPGRKKNRN
ncbi:FxSxx-COOH system tetratricopeptide repeat protein [Streptomyces sp. NPDC046909]|uniref:FxSxx-COOH system tetratricopeptide repeat protein n=1 Tax=Streptomyces sp. NPDC046909 TaxID=3155617 RepID=UPI003410DB3D